MSFRDFCYFLKGFIFCSSMHRSTEDDPVSKDEWILIMDNFNKFISDDLDK